MKKIICLDCEQEFTAETKEEVLQTMMPHYVESHKEMMDGQNDETKKEWFERFNKNWEEATEV